MKVNWRENKHVIASGVAHASILVFMLLSFAPQPFKAEASSGMPVDVISASEFNQMTKPNKVTSPKPIVEKKAPEAKPVEIRDAEISDLPDVQAPAPQASVPLPAAPPPEPKKEAEKPPEPKKAEKPPEPKPPEPKKIEKPPEPEKPDAEALARAAIEKQRQEAAKAEAERKKAEQQRKLAEAKKLEEQKKAEERKRAEQERIKLAKLAEQKSEDKSQFDSSAIQNLLDKRKPRRQAATGEEVNTAATAPAAGAAGAAMSGNDWNRFIARMRDCWTPPDGQDVRNIAVVLRIRMNKDGTLSADPQLVDRVAGSGYQVAADAAMRAVKGCAPYTFMPTAKYEQWKDFEINFDPRQMNRG
ncbi:IgA-specific serine endopeptidase autotransporter precursor [Variibacter gotjawalensis]|uniref:IgA-specific serine endopeptidase autotransporter n=1 Tax=Variibacter gotjawalensis TaxID=1333996 RepID=A0A0S3Q0E7_9BRAD|nr:cell envelope integrity protein TolA [Variibacter gotjawalensis]NIK47499.1 colicin import membrane protein [Variibacter gotjawalensis]RZS49395.1 cell division and transport-associated protein TolA [Variibacter gotjawalensis]BAT61658.1 IgA-specific serine endopeptidase autotransporter precursor [Variibacter gotjawalensis]